MFEYPELTTVTHNGRWYDCPKGFYPSITTVLGGTEPPEKAASLENWRNALGHAKAAEVSKKATDRGTNVHLLAERYLKKEQVDAPIGGKPVPQADLNSFNALKLKLNKVDQVWGQEVALYSETLEVAGRCDLVGQYKGIPCIVDFKTASRIKNRKDISDYELQLTFYAIAHNEMFGTDIQTGVILMVADTGFPMEFVVTLVDHYEELGKRVDAFWAKTLATA
jgi:genome maintenance exonuclease 1